MGDVGENILAKYWSTEAIESAIEKVVTELELNSEWAESWRVLYQLLCNIDKDITFSSKRLANLCLCYIKHSSAKAHLVLVSKVLVSVIEKGNLFEVNQDLKNFLCDVQSSIIRQSDTNQQHDGCVLDYETATAILSQILPASIKRSLFVDDSGSNAIKVIQSMIESKNEKSIVRAASFVHDTLIGTDSESLRLVFQSVRTLFHPDENIGANKMGNHAGLTALCSLAEVLFCDTVLSQQDWFLQCVQRFIFNPVALNRKRSQYLLKRYVDFAAADPGKAALFDDFFLVRPFVSYIHIPHEDVIHFCFVFFIFRFWRLWRRSSFTSSSPCSSSWKLGKKPS